MASDFRVDIKADKVREALNKIRLSLSEQGDMTGVMKSLGRVLLTGTQLRFRSGKGPEGQAWKTSKRASEEGGKTLRYTGGLRDSITYEATNGQVAIGTNKVYAAIHQFGGTIKHPGGTRYVVVNAVAVFVSNAFMGPVSGITKPHPIPMPARPFLGASESDQAELLRVLQAHYSDLWSK